MKIIIALLLALVAPLILLPIEHVFNYPYIFEELVNLLIIYLILLENKKKANANYWFVVISVGVLFTVSESVLYIGDFLSNGNIYFLPVRLILTGLLHTTNSVILYALGRKNWWLLIPGLIISVLIHYFFNLTVSGIH